MQPIASQRSPSLPPVPAQPEPAEVAAPAPSRSLVVAGAAPPSEPGLKPGARPSAPFLAHLIASAQQLPQTRARRRAEPREAVVHYAALGPAPTGEVLRTMM